MPSKLMPGKEARQHLVEAKENYERYQRLLLEPADVSWALVALFYSALHIVQAHATAKSKVDSSLQQPKTHRERISYVANHCYTVEAWYGPLQDLSEQVRYEMVKFSKDDVDKAHDQFFTQIRNYFDRIGFSWKKPDDL